MSVLSKLLQGVKKLETFAFISTSDATFEFGRLNCELLGCSSSSLHKLIIHDDSKSQHYMGHLISFEGLVELSANFSFLLGRQDEQHRRLIHVLPTSIRKPFLYLGTTAEPDEVEDVVN